jgi:hypothetical protein
VVVHRLSLLLDEAFEPCPQRSSEALRDGGELDPVLIDPDERGLVDRICRWRPFRSRHGWLVVLPARPVHAGHTVDVGVAYGSHVMVS